MERRGGLGFSRPVHLDPGIADVAQTLIGISFQTSPEQTPH
jgi:hypothetical protein